MRDDPNLRAVRGGRQPRSSARASPRLARPPRPPEQATWPPPRIVQAVPDAYNRLSSISGDPDMRVGGAGGKLLHRRATLRQGASPPARAEPIPSPMVFGVPDVRLSGVM